MTTNSVFGLIKEYGINLEHIVFYKKRIVERKDFFYFFTKKSQTFYYLEIHCLGDTILLIDFESKDSLDLMFEKVNRTVLQ